MFRQLVGFEWAYHTRQVSFAGSSLLALALGMQLGTNLVTGPGVYINAPATVNYIACLFSLGAIFVLMVTCANAMLRDAEHKMSELIFATAIEKWTLLSSRFVGALGAACTVVSIAMLGAFIGCFMPWVDAEVVGPIN
ncbi:MAG: hypothetical protein HRT35_00125, partial [Algicola sp.]|nr:hypothetical protein [Algicola sp.]